MNRRSRRRHPRRNAKPRRWFAGRVRRTAWRNTPSRISSSARKTVMLSRAHSGTSSISYFKNLDQLSIKALAYIYENNKKYTYQLKKISYQRKNGSISIPKQTYDLVLTTCNKQNQELQNIYLFQKI